MSSPLSRCISFCVFLFIEKANWLTHTHTPTHTHTSEKRGDRKVNIAGNNPVLSPWRTWCQGFVFAFHCPAVEARDRGGFPASAPRQWGPWRGPGLTKYNKGPGSDRRGQRGHLTSHLSVFDFCFWLSESDHSSV